MRSLKTILLVLMMCLCGKSMAQEILSSDMTITKPIYFMKLGDTPMKMDGVNDKATLRFFKFNSYMTYELELSGPTIKEICDSQKELKGDKLYFTWTGDTNRSIGAGCMWNDGLPMYLVATPPQRMDGILAESSDGWMVLITNQIPSCITDVHSGMTLSEITEGMKGLLKTTTVVMKETGTENGLKKYTLFGARLQDDIIRDDLTHLKQDDPYAHFYFDNAGKLVKWYQVK